MDMLCLPRGQSYRIAVCHAMLRRAVLSGEEEARVRDQMWRLERGMDGEQRADRFWEEMRLSERYRLFHNFETVGSSGYTHQMDTVFISARFVLILELKHIGGEIAYDQSKHQLLKKQHGNIQALGDPFYQVSRHEGWFETFLWDIGVRNLPIISAVVVTTTSSILRDMPKQFHVFKLEGLRFKLNQWFSEYPAVLNEQVLAFMGEELMKRHKPLKWRFPIENLQLRKGALCKCGLQMSYLNGVFNCKCGAKCRDGFVRGLEDYRLLVDEWITNKEFRGFFALHDPAMASKILNRLGLSYVGVTKSRRYLIPEDILNYRLYRRGEASFNGRK